MTCKEENCLKFIRLTLEQLAPELKISDEIIIDKIRKETTNKIENLIHAIDNVSDLTTQENIKTAEYLVLLHRSLKLNQTVMDMWDKYEIGVDENGELCLIP